MHTIVRTIALPCIAFGGAWSAPTLAATATGTFQVRLEIESTCSVAPNNINFGTYSGANADASAGISVACSKGTSWSLTVNQGTGAGATTTTRKMTSSAGDTLDYALYTDPVMQTVWANQAVGGSGATGNVPVWARVPAGQQKPAGSYSDTVTVTITY